MSTAQSKASAKYHAKVYERVAFDVKKGRRDQIRQFAASKGMSLNGYLNKLVESDMGDALRDDPHGQQPKP